MNETQVRANVSAEGLQTPENREKKSSADFRRQNFERPTGMLAQLDENLRQNPLPTTALALALGFVAARLAAASR